MNFLDIIAIPVSYLLKGISVLFNIESFAWLMFILTVLINVAMLPLTIKSQRSTAKQQMLKPKLDALKKKYGDQMSQKDKLEYQQEMQELYQKEGVSMAGGCLPLLIRMPFILAVYQIIQRPASYLKDVDISYMFFGLDLEGWPAFSLNFNNLSGDQLALWLFPVFAFAAQMFTSVLSMRMQKKLNPDQPNMTGMMLTMPLITLVIGFSVQAAVGLYWGFSSLVGGLLQAAVQYVYSPSKLIAADQAKLIVDRYGEEKSRMN